MVKNDQPLKPSPSLNHKQPEEKMKEECKVTAAIACVVSIVTWLQFQALAADCSRRNCFLERVTLYSDWDYYENEPEQLLKTVIVYWCLSFFIGFIYSLITFIACFSLLFPLVFTLSRCWFGCRLIQVQPVTGKFGTHLRAVGDPVWLKRKDMKRKDELERWEHMEKRDGLLV